MKKQLKDVIHHYLNTGLMFKHFDAERERESICRIVQWSEDEVTLTDGEYEYYENINDITPCFLPMSCLTEPEYQNVSDEFSEIEIETLFDSLGFAKLGLIENDTICNKLNFEGVQKLFKNHFNVFNLPESEFIDKRIVKL